jgi:hypothetical protein
VDPAPKQIHAGNEVDPVTDADVVRVSVTRRFGGAPSFGN